MSSTQTSGTWITTWDRSGRSIQVYSPPAPPAAPQPTWTDNNPWRKSWLTRTN